MYCHQCGSLLNPGTKFCTNCGTPVKQPEPTGYQPQNHSQQQNGNPPGFYVDPPVAPSQITFSDAVSTFFRKYAVFSGRATRREYWYVVLFNFLVSMLIGAVTTLLPELGGLLSGLYSLGTLIPGLTLFTRRMHDIGKRGWAWLWILVPLAGPIVLLVFVCRASAADNPYGPKPV